MGVYVSSTVHTLSEVFGSTVHNLHAQKRACVTLQVPAFAYIIIVLSKQQIIKIK